MLRARLRAACGATAAQLDARAACTRALQFAAQDDVARKLPTPQIAAK